jgi:pimeloyl-ACP methyl ester carboxylesterase
MTHQTITRTAVEGATIEYSDHGAGEALPLIHAGVFGAWFAPLEKLSPPGFRTIRMLRAGYADGPPPDRHLTIVDHARHAGQLLDTLGIGHAHVVAHSSGATSAGAPRIAPIRATCGASVVSGSNSAGTATSANWQASWVSPSWTIGSSPSTLRRAFDMSIPGANNSTKGPPRKIEYAVWNNVCRGGC